MKNSAAINQYLKEQASLDLLRFITCGSVDDGKSTLIGRLLYDSKMIFKDQLQQLEADSKKSNSNIISSVDFQIKVYSVII